MRRNRYSVRPRANYRYWILSHCVKLHSPPCGRPQTSTPRREPGIPRARPFHDRVPSGRTSPRRGSAVANDVHSAFSVRHVCSDAHIQCGSKAVQLETGKCRYDTWLAPPAVAAVVHFHPTHTQSPASPGASMTPQGATQEAAHQLPDMRTIRQATMVRHKTSRRPCSYIRRILVVYHQRRQRQSFPARRGFVRTDSNLLIGVSATHDAW